MIKKHPLLAVLILGLILRVVLLPNAFYGTAAEMFRDLIVVYNMFSSGELVLLGPSASLGGFYFGAMYYYIMAPFVWLVNFEHYGAILTSTVFSLASIAMVYHLTKLWFSRTDVALLSAILTMVSVFDIQNAYYLSNPNLLPFFLLVYWYGLTKLLQDKLTWPWAIAAGLAAGIATQLHSTALFVLPLATLAVVLIKRPAVSLTKGAVALVVAVITYAPFFIYEAQHSFTNTKRIFELGAGNFSIVPNVQSVYGSVNHFINLFIIRNDIFDFVYLYPLVFAWLGAAVLAFLWIMVRFLVRHASQQGLALHFSHAGGVIVKVWLVVTALTFLFYTNTVHFFYYLVIWPLPVILLAWYLQNLKLAGWTKQFYASAAVLIIVQMTQLPFFYNFIYHPELTYNNFKQIYQQIDADANNQSYRIINDTKYVNHMLYYLKVSGYDNAMAADRADVVYILGEDEQADSQFELTNYELANELKFEGFVVDKYIKTE